jgi:acetyl-CoA carboxylase biotin carboxyl carrier protein
MTPEGARQTISELITLIGRSDVADLELADGDLRLRLHRPKARADDGQEWPAVRPDAGATASAPQVVPAPRTIRSPIVGRFYRARHLEDEPLVREGDTVVAGQAVGVVEAMNLFSDIESEESGRVTRLLIGNGDRVEYGQPLMELD